MKSPLTKTKSILVSYAFIGLLAISILYISGTLVPAYSTTVNPPIQVTSSSVTTSSVRISWTNPSGTISGFKIEKSSPVGGSWSTVANTTNSTNRYDLTGLAGHTQYNIRISTNSSGTFSSPSYAYNFYTLTNSPSGLGLTQTTPTTLRLSWTGSSGNTTSIGYKIERAIGSGSWSVLVANTTNSTTHYDDAGLTPGDLYAYRVSALEPNSTQTTYQMNDTNALQSWFLNGTRSIIAEFATPSSALVGKTIDSITLDLQKVGSPTGTATIGIINTDKSFKQQFGTIDVSTLTTSLATYTFSLGASQSYQIASNDRIGIQYSGGNSANYIRMEVDTSNAFDGTNSYRTQYAGGWQNFTTQDPYMVLKLHTNTNGVSTPSSSASRYVSQVAPTQLTSSLVTPSSARISWTNPTGNFSGFKIESSSPVGGTWSTVVSNTANSTNHYDLTNLVGNTQYNIRISTNYANENNVTNSSNPYNFHTLPSQPNNVYVNRTASTTAYVSWSTPNENTTSNTRYEIDRSINGGATWSTLVANTGNTTTHYYDTNLNGSKLYAYRILTLEQYATSSPSATIAIFNPISYSNPNPSLPHNITQFFTLVPANETGFKAGEQVTTSYSFPNGTCSTTQSVDSNGKIVTDSPTCAQGSSSSYLGYGALEGRSYNVTATGQSSGQSTTITFVPTLTNGSSWNTGSSCSNNCSTPTVANSTLHLVYFNTAEAANSTYTAAINYVQNSHNAIGNYSKISGFDYASSFSSRVLDAYPANITKIILEYNDTGHTNGTQQGIASKYNWVGYDDERFNGAQSTPCIEIQNNCPNGSGLNATAVEYYTNHTSQQVKSAGKHFVWAGELAAVNAAYQHVNWNNIDMVILQLQGPTTANNTSSFNSTLAQISDYAKSKNSKTLVIAQVNTGYIGFCSCTIPQPQLVYDYQYSRFHGGTPTKFIFDGASLVISTTKTADVDRFISYLGR